MKILLTEKQDAMLRDMFVMVNADWEKGTPGVLAGQFFESTEGPGFFEVGYIESGKASALIRALGLIETLTPLKVTVFTDVD